jgi:4-hydroxyphenylpyruvate dioxygenase
MKKSMNKRGACSFMEPTVEKDEFGEVVRSKFIPMEKRFIFVERKNYNLAFSLPDIKNGI